LDTSLKHTGQVPFITTPLAQLEHNKCQQSESHNTTLLASGDAVSVDDDVVVVVVVAVAVVFV